MPLNEFLAATEALLFAAGEPLELERIAVALHCGTRDAGNLLEELSAVLKERGSGLCILRLDNKAQLCANPAYAQMIRETLETKRNTPLTSAALEVLAIAAYHQPVTKSYMEQVRGVDCSRIVNNLCERGLLEEAGRMELPGRPILYKTTDAFLRAFGLSSLKDLPPLGNETEPNDMPTLPGFST